MMKMIDMAIIRLAGMGSPHVGNQCRKGLHRGDQQKNLTPANGPNQPV